MIELAKIFSDGMILQREKAAAVWGRADAGAEVAVSVQGQQGKTTAGQDGAWKVLLPPLHASTGEVMIVESQGETITVQDVAVGEVWIAGGQSNMEFPLCYEKNREQELGNGNRNLRFYDVPEKFYEEQDVDFDYSNVGIWRKAEGESLTYFSAAGYYFQKELEAELSVPVGIVGCNWGGTKSCAWMDEKTVERVGAPWAEEWRKVTAGMDMDRFWTEQRKNPQSNAGNPARDPFSAFILPTTPTLREIAAFLRSTAKAAGMPVDDNADIEEQMAASQPGVDARTKPGILFEHMVKKIAPYTARGVIWYQGESDDEVEGLQRLYADMMEGLIGDWRRIWEDENLPFIQVQLPGWASWMLFGNNDFVTIRRCQEDVAKRVPHVYLASISDVGEERDIHPKDKKTVGHRLALLARHYVYGEELLCEAPRPEKAERDGRKIVITFQYAGSGLRVAGESIQALRVTADGEALGFTAKAAGRSLVLELDTETKGEVCVEFAQDKWYQVNLFNEAGIPAIPFRVSC